MSLFAETVSRAIGDYRKMLRRYLTQAERVAKLKQLNLKEKDPTLFQDDVRLYKLAQLIIDDIDENMKVPEKGYYSYSGIANFCEYLKEYLANYEVDGEEVVHRAQKASKALIQAIQLVALPDTRLGDMIASKLKECNEVIAAYGSTEQRQLHLSNLERHQERNENFYAPIVSNFREEISSVGEAAY